MVVMVAVGSWSLGYASTVGIVYVFYGINLFFGINIYAGIKSIHPVRPGPKKFILFVNIPGLFSVYSGINRENKFYTNNGSHPIGVDYVARMNLYNLIFQMVILIPFLTQPPHERTLTGRGSWVYPKGRGSRVYPNVGAAGCTLTSGQPGAAWSGQEVCSGIALAACAARLRFV
jgi:hypothetical protein